MVSGPTLTTFPEATFQNRFSKELKPAHQLLIHTCQHNWYNWEHPKPSSFGYTSPETDTVSCQSVTSGLWAILNAWYPSPNTHT